MAKIKIPQSESQVKVGGVTQTGALALPIVQLSQVVGSGYKALGKVVEDIHKEQVTAEDNAQFQDIIKKASVDIERISTAASRGTDVKLAVDTFEKLTKPEKWNELTNGKRKKVKTKFNQWLNKQKLTEYVSITKAVTANHVKHVKVSNNTYLDDLTLKASSTNAERSINALNELNGWFEDPVNSIPYDIDEWEKLKEDKLKQAQKLAYQFGAKNNPDWTLANRKDIEKVVGPYEADKLVETAKLKIASNVNAEDLSDATEIKNRQDYKIGNFTEFLVRIKNQEDVPSLDVINDFWKEDKLNTAQYEALIKFYANPNFTGSDDIYDLINEQIFFADDAEEHDALQRKLNLSPDYLMSLGIKDISAISGIIEKSKDRQVYQDMKYYKTVLDDTLGKLDEGGFISLSNSEDPKKDKKLRTKAQRLYNEGLDQNLSPEDAFMRVVKGFLLHENRMPVIYDIAAITSIATPEPSDADKKGKPEDVFDNWRTKAMDEYKKGNIGFDELLNDLDGLDTMQDLFNIRKRAEKHIPGFDAWSSNNSTTSGTGEGSKL
jgi:hypothetical protein